MEENKNVCPCCGRHCDLSAPSCERGEEYARTGVIPEKKGHGEHGEHGERHGKDGHEHHGEYGHLGEYGPHEHHGCCGERPPHGPGRRKEFGSILDSERYAAMDEDNKLMAMLHELRHMGRFGFDGKGGQNRILRMLTEDGAMTQRALTERLGIQPGSASEVLGKLEKAGFITRTQSAADRRTTDVALTDAGRAQAAEAAARRDERVHEMFSVLSGEEKAELLTAMEKLNRAWSAKAKEQGRDGCHGPHEGRHSRHGEHGHHEE